MAPLLCFFNLISTFFSILPSDYERRLKDEIWGCFKYIGFSIDAVMKMPIQDRKYYIMRHNAEVEESERGGSYSPNTNTYSGDLNGFAQLEQSNAKLRGGQI